MLTLLAAEGTRLDAGSVGLALSRRWSDAGDPVLFVDADTSGSRLAERFGEAVRAEYSPAVRGLPSLIVAREPLTLKLLADHCYSLDASGGLLWALFAPYHPAGAQHAARWLGEHADDLRAVDRQRSVIVSASLRNAADSLEPLLGAVPVVVVLAAVESADAAKGLWTLCRDAGLMSFARRHRLLIVEGSSPLDDDEIHAESGLRVAGRLPVLDDDKILRLQGGRRERAFACGARQDHGPHLGAHGPRHRRGRAHSHRRDGCWRGGCGRDGRGGRVGGAARFGPFRRQRRRDGAGEAFG